MEAMVMSIPRLVAICRLGWGNIDDRGKGL
jgi:hypothetical protein